MKALTLYEISEKYQFLLQDMYDHETGEINEEVFAQLNELSDTAESKCINVVKVFEEYKKSIEAIKVAKDRMLRHERVLKNGMERLKNYLQTNMEKCEIKKIECPEFVISLQKNPVALDVFNLDEIPHEYDVRPAREIDRSRIKDELKNGVVIPGARLVQGNSVRIR